MSDRLSEAMAFKALQPLDGHGFADLVMTTRRPATPNGARVAGDNNGSARRIDRRFGLAATISS
jgi:hypothetical protein